MNDLGMRMYRYEHVSKNFLIRQMPVIIRLDGRSFGAFTRHFNKPFDSLFIQAMWDTAKALCAEVQNCRMAYVASDEISLVLLEKDINAQPYFDNQVQKIVSTTAAFATMIFNQAFTRIVNRHFENIVDDVLTFDKLNFYVKKFNMAMFDSRAFNLPVNEVTNYFIWRQEDYARNAVSQVARSFYKQHDLQNKSGRDLVDMIFEKNVEYYNDYAQHLRLGAVAFREEFLIPRSTGTCDTKDIGTDVIRHRWSIDNYIPEFVDSRHYIDSLVGI